MSRLVLIDGNAILHRAYHALPPLTNRNGQQVNAVYGFGSIMLRIIDELKPEYLAVAFDRPEPTFRKQLYIGYQAKRKEMDAELAGQVDLVHELVGAYGVKIFEKAGYEADDILGTIAARFSENQARNPNIEARRKFKVQSTKNKKQTGGKYIDSDLRRNDKEKVDEVVIVTGDRDLMQLVNEQVKLYMPTRGMSEGEMVGASEVKAKLGVSPEQVIDYKALVGDGSDNYPGIPGLGPKGAVDLLSRFGSFGNIVSLIDKSTETKAESTEITELVKQKIIRGKDSGELSYKLATIKTDVELELDLERLRVGELNKDGLIEFFRQMGFRSLVKRLGGNDRDDKGEKGDKGNKGNAISENQQSLF